MQSYYNRMESDQIGKVYDKLIEIFTVVGQIQSDIATVKTDVRNNYVHAEEADKAFDAKLEKYFNRTDDEVKELKKDIGEVLDNHETRIKALEEKRSKTIMGWIDRARDWVIWAVIVALLGGVAVTVKQLAKALWDVAHMIPPAPPAM